MGTQDDPAGGRGFPRRLLTVREVAEYLGLSPQTVQHMCRKHQTPHLKVRNRLRFEPDALRRWLDAHRRGYARGADAPTGHD